MALYLRPDSPFYWMHLEGFRDGRGRPLQASTKVRHDAPTPTLRREAKQQAEVVYHERMLALSRETEGQSAKRPAIAFATFAAWYATHMLPQRRGREREREILARLVAEFGAQPLRSIDRARVQEYMTTRLTTPIMVVKKRRTAPRVVRAGPATVNREVDLLKAILQAAVPKYLPASPLYGMKRLRTVTPKRRILTEAEEARLLPRFSRADRALFLIGLDALVRLSDILDVRWEDDHGDQLWIADPKAGGGFSVPLSARARHALDRVPRNRSEYIFAHRRRAKTERDRRNGIRHMLERACAQAGVPFGRRVGGITFHWATRRTGATRMLTRAIDPGTVQKVGRWKTADVVLGIYHELLDSKAREAVEAVGPVTMRSRQDHVGRKRRKSRINAA
jgi:integrase